MAKKKPEPNPIEKAIGDRTKPKNPSMNNLDPENPPIPQNPSEIPDEPSPSEMLTLEELNRQTEERLQDDWPGSEVPIRTVTGKTVKVPQAPMPSQKTLVSKPDPQPVTENSSQESPPQGTKKTTPISLESVVEANRKQNEITESTLPKIPPQKIGKEFHPVSEPIPNIEKLPPDFKVKHTYDTGIVGCTPAEDVELTALKKYILDDGFVLATVAFHIVSLCAQPMTTPSTTTWDFVDRASIPDMVLALLNQPGYLEGIWPSLKIVMGSNKGNAAWTAGIATTIAFFDVIRTLPAIEELKNETEKKKNDNLGL